MTKLTVNTANPYNITIGAGIFSSIDAVIPDGLRAAVITDSNVKNLYGNYIGSLPCFTFPAGEKSKDIKTYSTILEFLAENKISRTDFVIALGGGVVGDIAGFAAATYLRGVSYVQVPTTLLAMVDSSVGGKTAINLGHGKNLAGCFYQPAEVLCDTDFLDTLSPEEYKNGMGEVIKYLAIRGFDLSENIESTIESCLKIKSDIVAEDTFDNGARQLLNFGHTFGHAIEKHSCYKVNHGTAVAIGMVKITEWSEAMGITEKGTADVLKSVLDKHKLPYKYPVTANGLFALSLNDKKIRGKKITLVLLEKMGRAGLFDFETDKIQSMRPYR